MLTYREYLDKAKREYVRTVLRLADGNVTAAAAIAGMNRTALHDLLAREGLRSSLQQYNRRGNWEGCNAVGQSLPSV